MSIPEIACFGDKEFIANPRCNSLSLTDSSKKTQNYSVLVKRNLAKLAFRSFFVILRILCLEREGQGRGKVRGWTDF